MKKIYLGPDPQPIVILAGPDGVKQIEEAFRAELEKEIGRPIFAEIPIMEYKARPEFPEIKKSGRESRRERRAKQRKNKKS